MNRKVRIVILATVAVAVLAVAGFMLAPTVRRALAQPPKEFAGVSLGDSKAEIEYKLGIPHYVLGDILDKSDPYAGFQVIYDVQGSGMGPNSLPKGSDFMTYRYWSYSGQAGDGTFDKDITVTFDKRGVVQGVDCTSLTIQREACPTLLGIRISDSEDHLVDTLGEPDFQKYDNTTKTVFYQRLDVAFTLQKRQVYIMQLVRPGSRPWKAGS